MYGLGTLANCVAIIIGALLGVFCKRGLPEKWQETMMNSIALLAGFVGPLVTEAMLAEITASGGTMVMAIGCNMLKITQIRIGNLLPGMLFAALITAIIM